MHLLRYLWFFATHFDIKLIASYPRCAEHGSRRAFKKQVKSVSAVKPPHFQSPNVDPNTSPKDYISSKAGLDHAIFPASLQTHIK